jgi:hypothetical protein
MGHLQGLNLGQLESQDAVHPEAFHDRISRSLADGSFRLVIALDSAPDELIQVVGYLQMMTDKSTKPIRPSATLRRPPPRSANESEDMTNTAGHRRSPAPDLSEKSALWLLLNQSTGRLAGERSWLICAMLLLTRTTAGGAGNVLLPPPSTTGTRAGRLSDVAD